MQASNGDTPLLILSELEGAILSELQHRGRQTAFKVRRSFATSPSLEWRGSAGSVYAAIKRLEGQGMIESEDQSDKRGTRLLGITPAGEQAMAAWACDLTRAISVGVDPFRLRAGVWGVIDTPAKVAMVAALERALIQDIEKLKAHRRYGDAIETASVDLAIRLQQSRLDWLSALSGR